RAGAPRFTPAACAVPAKFNGWRPLKRGPGPCSREGRGGSVDADCLRWNQRIHRARRWVVALRVLGRRARGAWVRSRPAHRGGLGEYAAGGGGAEDQLAGGAGRRLHRWGGWQGVGNHHWAALAGDADFGGGLHGDRSLGAVAGEVAISAAA